MHQLGTAIYCNDKIEMLFYSFFFDEGGRRGEFSKSRACTKNSRDTVLTSRGHMQIVTSRSRKLQLSTEGISIAFLCDKDYQINAKLRPCEKFSLFSRII